MKLGAIGLSREELVAYVGVYDGSLHDRSLFGNDRLTIYLGNTGFAAEASEEGEPLRLWVD